MIFAAWIVVSAVLRFAAILSPVGLGSQTAEAATKEIRAVIAAQQEAWNRGDIDGFAQAYWKSSDVTFAGSSGVTRGWQPVVNRYHEHYRDREAMGQLDFSDLEVHMLGKDAAFVLGRWHLKRAKDQPSGVFTLVFERLPEGWRIVHDHTSLDDKPAH